MCPHFWILPLPLSYWFNMSIDHDPSTDVFTWKLSLKWKFGRKQWHHMICMVTYVTVCIFSHFQCINTVTDEDLRGRNVLHYHPFKLLRDRSVSAPTLSYAVAMSLYQIIVTCIHMRSTLTVKLLLCSCIRRPGMLLVHHLNCELGVLWYLSLLALTCEDDRIEQQTHRYGAC